MIMIKGGTMEKNVAASGERCYVVVFHSSERGPNIVEVALADKYPSVCTPNFWTSKGIYYGAQIVREFNTQARALDFVTHLGGNPRLELLTRWAEYHSD